MNGKWGFGGNEKRTDKCFMVVVSERLKNEIKEHVHPYSTVTTGVRICV